MKFEADIIDPEKIDLALELELSQAVDAPPRAGGGYDLVQRGEPNHCPPFDDVLKTAPLLRLYLEDKLIFDNSATMSDGLDDSKIISAFGSPD